MRIDIRIKISGEIPFFSIGPMELLEKIEKHSSIKKATEAMGMSYTKALRIIRNAEKELGFALVISEKGGNQRGQTMLTDQGKQVLAAFQEFYSEVSHYARQCWEERYRFIFECGARVEKKD